jgi:YegS/Rv2252/BmrU family lipid kinase
MKRLLILINPAAGPDRPVLSLLNTAFHASGWEWDIAITQKDGDAQRFAAQAAHSGIDIIAVYGGDGTVMEAASGLIGLATPLAIIPGGTANTFSHELGIPADIREACQLITGAAPSVLRMVDLIRVGEGARARYFVLRVGTGLEAQLVEGAPRMLKDLMGTLAYGVAALQALSDPRLMRYTLTLDGKKVEVEGVACSIVNASNLGAPEFYLAPHVDLSDGKLDVFVLRRADLPALWTWATSAAAGNPDPALLQRWQAREVTLHSDPPMNVQGDGELLGPTPITARAVPNAVRVIVPNRVVGGFDPAKFATADDAG